MRILVYPHDLEIGGSQLNAIDLAAAVGQLGHEVCVYGDSGPLVANIEKAGLEFIPSPSPGRRPSPAVVADLRSIVRGRHIDVVHGYEWPPVLEASLAVVGTGTRVVSTVMSMAVAGFLPRTVQLVVGTEQIAHVERVAGRNRVAVVEPPVDLDANYDGVADPAEFRRAHGIDATATLIVSVARLAHELKLEGTLVAIDVVADLAALHRVQLVLVGDGPAREDVRARAAAANREAGRTVVILTGSLNDPRPAYQAADIALGMGGSALRAMAFGTPLVVQGERGFWQTLTPDSLDQFLWSGWYGLGSGSDAGPDDLRNALLPLLLDAELRCELGRFGSTTVTERFSLTAAARVQESLYLRAAESSEAGTERLLDAARSTALYAKYFVEQRIARLRGSTALDDFNSAPVAMPRRSVE